MGRFLILIAIVMAIVWLMRGDRRGRQQQRTRAGESAAGERMVPCARCGVYLPLGEAIAAEGRYYCSEEHRRSSAG